MDKKDILCIEQQVEDIRRWAAARAGLIVVAPFVGTIALLANEVYMIGRIATAYGVKLSDSAIIAFLGALGGAFVGQTVITLLPFAPLQIPVGVGVTYAVGMVAEVWIKEGMPSDVSHLVDKFKRAKVEAKAQTDLLLEHPDKYKPLGDENRKF